jgi:cytochrome c
MSAWFVRALIVVGVGAPAIASAAEGDVARGQRLFQTCAACHSLQPNKNMTGPSLSGLWNQKAGHVDSFTRYSSALKSSSIIWNDQTLDAWLTDPQHVIPGNTMTFPGIKDAQPRADLLAFLKQATQPGAQTAQQNPPTVGMGGMMGGGRVPNLKNLEPGDRVKSVSYCRDTYDVATADGKTRKFWERNLRFKTDSSEDGPSKSAPALVPAGMMGDRADVIFSAPEEIGQFVSQSC